MSSSVPRELVSAHSPDSDDAFMFYGLATRKVRSTKVSFRHVLEDIQSLNRKAMDGLYELTPLGRDLSAAIEPLDAWSRRWARALSQKDLAQSERTVNDK